MVNKKHSNTKKEKQQVRDKTLVLLDAHAILHRAYHALPDFTSPTGEPTGALYGVVAMLLKIIEELKPDYIVACYDLPEPTHRHLAYDAYKAGRVKTDDALISQIIRSRDIFAAFGVPVYEVPGFEADDILGTIAHETTQEQDLKVVIASGDMDTLQLVDDDRVFVYTLKKGIQDTILYNSKAVVDRYGFGPERIPDYKGLRGDPSDNIPGIKGIGEKIATELITHFGSIEALYKKLKKDEQAFLTVGIKPRIIELLKANEEEALFSKMLGTIRTDAPIAFRRPEKLWRETLDSAPILELFNELGFRTLAQRVKNLFEYSDADSTSVEEGNVDARTLRETAIALWLLQSDITNPTLEDILQYGRGKGAATFVDARAMIMHELKEAQLEKVFADIELPLMEVIDEMERWGVCIDVAYLKTLSETMHYELDVLETQIHTDAGVIFNVNSPKQLADVLYDTLNLKPKNQKRTATGQRSTRESELEKLIEVHPVITRILRYRELQKLVGTYIDTIPTMVREDGRLHTTFLQAGSTTGRMASQNPGIQNIPVRTNEGRAIRRAFIAADGYTLISIDYSQIELRIAAFLSGDPKLIEIFKNGEDVHRGVASRVFKVSPEEVTPNMRRSAKVINFGILYGMGVNALRTNLGEATSRAEAQEFLNAYFNTFTRLAEYLEETKAYAHEHGYTLTYFGRRRYFSGINSSLPFMRAQAERMAINAPIQGTSADITRIAMVSIHEYLTREKLSEDIRLLIQVHDELVFEIKNERVAEVLPILKTLMEGILTSEETQGVPIIVEAKGGRNWEEMNTL